MTNPPTPSPDAAGPTPWYMIEQRTFNEYEKSIDPWRGGRWLIVPLNIKRPWVSFTDDPQKATRFTTRAEAERTMRQDLCDYVERYGTFVSEHLWMEPTSPLSSSGRTPRHVATTDEVVLFAKMRDDLAYLDRHKADQSFTTARFEIEEVRTLLELAEERFVARAPAAASPEGSAGLDAASAFDQTGVGAIASTSIDDGHSWVRSIDPALTSIVWCQWCGTHRVEVRDWLDNPQCKGILAARALASAIPGLIDASRERDELKKLEAIVRIEQGIHGDWSEGGLLAVGQALIDRAAKIASLEAQLTDARSSQELDKEAALGFARQIGRLQDEIASLRSSREQAIAAIETVAWRLGGKMRYPDDLVAAIAELRAVLSILRGAE